MRAFAARIGRDIGARRNVDAYVTSAAALVMAVLSLLGDLVPVNLRWAVLLAAAGLLVYRITVPAVAPGSADTVLADRGSFDTTPLAWRLRGASEVWIAAPSAISLLSPGNCDLIRQEVLAHATGRLRVMVLDPHGTTAMETAARQLDDAVRYSVQHLGPSLDAMVPQLAAMHAWDVPGSTEYRLLAFNPGFSIVAVDPDRPDGRIIVEFHGVHNDSAAQRMHLELRRTDSPHWYAYWREQLTHLWTAAREPDPA